MENLSKKISYTIRSIRESKQVKQVYMARRLKVTQQAYSRMENDPQNLTLKRLIMIADILEVELVTLLGIDTALIQQNFGQQGGNSATQMVQNYTTAEKNELYERIIAQLKEEIAYLRPLGLGKKTEQENKENN
jgi:transcriptional regulator with XRE-family HTH domain